MRYLDRRNVRNETGGMGRMGIGGTVVQTAQPIALSIRTLNQVVVPRTGSIRDGLHLVNHPTYENGADVIYDLSSDEGVQHIFKLLTREMALRLQTRFTIHTKVTLVLRRAVSGKTSGQ